LSVAGYPNDDYGISVPQGVTVPESVSNSYPSPASTVSAGNSPQALDAATVSIAASSNIPISRTSELDFALQNSSGRARAPNTQQQQDHYTPNAQADQQKGPNANLATRSGDASTLSSSTLYQPEQDLGPQGQYTYSSISECYTPDGQPTMPISATNITAALYNSYGEINLSSLDPSGLQNVNVETFTAYT
jgi:hypothetical protein